MADNALTKTEAIAKANSARTSLRNFRAKYEQKAKKGIQRVAGLGGAYLGGSLFGDNFVAAGILGGIGAGLDMMGYESPFTMMLEGNLYGAAYCYGSQNPPEFLSGIRETIQGKLSGGGGGGGL